MKYCTLEQNNSAQQIWLGQADTFFIATYHPQSGADASHRGGSPGFVQVVDARTLEFPDYPGNNLFNTLGNLTVDPRAGLALVDFDNGRSLQLTGTAEVDWRSALAARLPGAARVVRFSIETVVESQLPRRQRWDLRDPSPFNPSAHSVPGQRERIGHPHQADKSPASARADQ